MAMKRGVVEAATIGGVVLAMVGAIFAGQAIAASNMQPADTSVVVEKETATPKPTETPTPTPTVAPVAEVPAPAPVVEAPVAEPAPEPVYEEPAAPEADLCPPGTTSNGSDGFNDTSCMPLTCYDAPRGFPDPNFPECDYFYPPSYYR